jgi:hypothetical protein
MALSCVGAGDLSVVALAEAERVASRAHYFTVLDARGSHSVRRLTALDAPAHDDKHSESDGATPDVH